MDRRPIYIDLGPLSSDRQTLLDIAQLLNTREWNSDTLSDVADILRSNGFSIDDLEEE